MVALPAFVLHGPALLAGVFLSCKEPPPPHVSVVFHNTPAVINNELSASQLAAMRMTSVSPDYGGEFPNVEGLTIGTVEIEHAIDFQTIVQKFLGYACVSATQVNIDITYKPVVYIKNTSPPGSCRYTATMDHEAKHMLVDLTTLKEFIPSLKAQAAASVAAAQAGQPPTSADVAARQKFIAEALKKSVGEVQDAFQKRRTIAQIGVDTHEEYERLSKLCPGEP